MMHQANPQGRCDRCGAAVYYRDKVCKHCGQPNRNWTVPDKHQCGNCHAVLAPEDKYCRICGTRAGDGAYEPYQQLMQCIYGPMPQTRTHVCRRCGYSWETCQMIDRDRYCPQCGGDAPYREDVPSGRLPFFSDDGGSPSEEGQTGGTEA